MSSSEAGIELSKKISSRVYFKVLICLDSSFPSYLFQVDSQAAYNILPVGFCFCFYFCRAKAYDVTAHLVSCKYLTE